MRKRILSVFMLILTFIMMFGNILSVSAFTTTSNTNDWAGSADDDEWAYRAITGTRYAIRVNGEDLSGSNDAWLYWMNHVQFYKRWNSSSNVYYYDDGWNVSMNNATVEEETEGGRSSSSWQMMEQLYFGVYSNATRYVDPYNSDASRKRDYFFSTKASSIESYPGMRK